jgi:hypothetical protein
MVTLMSGCATVVNSSYQDISVETRSKDGEFVEGAECKLNNDKGNWSVRTPGTATVNKSATDLYIRCEKDGHDAGSAVAISRVNGAIFGNILIGGVIGAIVDHHQGTGYDYPDRAAIEMGAHRTIDIKDGNTVTVSTQPSPAGGGSDGSDRREGAAAQPPPAASPRRDGTTTSLDDLKELLPPR